MHQPCNRRDGKEHFDFLLQTRVLTESGKRHHASLRISNIMNLLLFRIVQYVINCSREIVLDMLVERKVPKLLAIGGVFHMLLGIDVAAYVSEPDVESCVG